ncbi:MAG: DUF692 family multinuclear iron-containing protein [Rickettsiales bacterium]
MQPVSSSRAGIGLRAPHVDALLDGRPDIGWLEVHPENYFCGGLHADRLTKVRELYPVSFHGVGLSLGSAHAVSHQHLAQLKQLVDRHDPVRVSDHASWSASGNAHLNDLLPLPYTEESLAALCRNIAIVQDTLGRQILIENPSTYVTFTHSTLHEADFMAEASHLTGCGILLDVNNIHVQAHNHGLDALDYLTRLPISAVQEIHLAGHIEQAFGDRTLYIDTHSRPVSEAVWALYDTAIARFGAVPTLVEWDKDLPTLDVLLAEAAQAETRMAHGAAHVAA